MVTTNEAASVLIGSTRLGLSVWAIVSGAIPALLPVPVIETKSSGRGPATDLPICRAEGWRTHHKSACSSPVDGATERKHLFQVYRALAFNPIRFRIAYTVHVENLHFL